MISPDLPIMKSSEDKLNRESFVKSLANVILQSAFPTSFTVGLYGAWGSGKTSLLNMVIEQIERSSTDVVILRFNPWLCSDPKQLITQFFKQLASAIKMKNLRQILCVNWSINMRIFLMQPVLSHMQEPQLQQPVKCLQPRQESA